MLSRTAANLFWMGRHLERAETAAAGVDRVEVEVVRRRGGGESDRQGAQRGRPARPG